MNTTGMYSLVRHPLYLGNFIIWLGLVLIMASWQTVAIFVLAFWLYYERIMVTEENFLGERFGSEFVDWAERTPAFVPRLSRWRRPELAFSPRSALRREYGGIFAFTACYFAIDLMIDYRVRGQFEWEPLPVAMACTGAVLYVTLRTLKRHTRLLAPPGRLPPSSSPR